jgi:hypothetical protein
VKCKLSVCARRACARPILSSCFGLHAKVLGIRSGAVPGSYRKRDALQVDLPRLTPKDRLFEKAEFPVVSPKSSIIGFPLAYPR